MLFPLANYGVGSRVTRSTWNTPNCFWEITRVKYNKRAIKEDGALANGKAWGTLYWNNEPRGRPDRKIPAPLKARKSPCPLVTCQSACNHALPSPPHASDALPSRVALSAHLS